MCKFEKPKGNPALFEPEPATTVLSPYMKFGCISCRLFYHRLKGVYAKHAKHTSPPVSLEGQLLWREFFYTVGFATPNFHKVRVLLNRIVAHQCCIQSHHCTFSSLWPHTSYIPQGLVGK